jgi:hypothetical protein
MTPEGVGIGNRPRLMPDTRGSADRPRSKPRGVEHHLVQYLIQLGLGR